MATTGGIRPIADPRGPDPAGEGIDDVYQRTWGLTARVDSTVTFEEYCYWAGIEREEELENERIYQEEAGPLTYRKKGESGTRVDCFWCRYRE
jgi:hypothetical protein